jgi:hypothetical protein
MPFDPKDRMLLMSTPGIGSLVLQRLEEAGFDSLEAIQLVGVDTVVHVICAQQRSKGWSNRRRALERALIQARQIDAAKFGST